MKELGADYIATGHYARITEEIQNGETKYQLRMAKDRSKDQSYFLYTLTQEKLKHILFPIGEYTKPEVRELAKKFGIDEVNKQKESQNLCFFPESTHGPFLKRYLEKQHFEPGKIVTKDGEHIGTHNGLPLYTIGQRKGLGIGGIKGKEHLQGQPWYVIKLDTDTNSVIVGYEEDLYTSTFKTNTMTFIDPADTKTQPEPPTYEAKIRYRFFSQPAKLQVKDPESASVEFIKPQRAITPGQSVVFYDNDRVVGGGIIE
jgi:tRNA-specific 2-thiouridylase